MKLKYLLSLGLLVIFQWVQAQETAVTRPARKAIISIAPLSLSKSSGQLKLRGEYVLNARKSATLTIGIPKKLKLPSNFGDYLVTSEQGNSVITDAASTSKLFSALVDFRFYKASKGAPRGFYYAPYLRLLKGSMDLSIENEEFNFTERLKGYGYMIGGGINLGVNWLIKNRVSIDWTFLALGFQAANGTFSYSTTDPTVDLQRYTDDVVRNLGKIPLIGSKFKVAAAGDYVAVSLKNQLLPDAAMRLTIGVAF
jgi:hypothetical protein